MACYLTWRRGDAHEEAIHDHLYAYGRTRGFLTTHARLSEGGKGPAVQEDLDLYCYDFGGCSKDSSPCEHYHLFLGFLGRGRSTSRASIHAKGSRSRRESWPRCWFHIQASSSQLSWVSDWRDGAEAKLHGEVFRRFIRGWLQTGVDRQHIKGV